MNSIYMQIYGTSMSMTKGMNVMSKQQMATDRMGGSTVSSSLPFHRDLQGTACTAGCTVHTLKTHTQEHRGMKT